MANLSSVAKCFPQLQTKVACCIYKCVLAWEYFAAFPFVFHRAVCPVWGTWHIQYDKTNLLVVNSNAAWHSRFSIMCCWIWCNCELNTDLKSAGFHILPCASAFVCSCFNYIHMMLRQPSNAYKFCALATLWMLDTPVHPSLQHNTSFSLRAQLLLQFEMMFWVFTKQFSPVPNSAICTCTQKRGFADANVVLLYAWSCACRILCLGILYTCLDEESIFTHWCFQYMCVCRNTYFLFDFYLSCM